SIATPPPQLVVVKNGFRNVPRVALFGANLQSPANAGLETYFWANPMNEPGVLAQTKQAIVTITPPPRLGAPANVLGTVLRALLLGGAALGLVLVARRHPLIGRRLLLMGPTMLVVSVIVFTLVQLPPGDFAEMRATRLEMEGTSASEELA